MKDWYISRELAGLPGMPTTMDAIRKMGRTDRLASRRRQVGKGSEYRADSLPEETQAHLRAQDSGQEPIRGPRDARLDALGEIVEQLAPDAASRILDDALARATTELKLAKLCAALAVARDAT